MYVLVAACVTPSSLMLLLQAHIAETLVCQYKVPSEEIAVLTPYSAQKEVIKDKLKQRRELRNKTILVKTITESQGVYTQICYKPCPILSIAHVNADIYKT